jgi:ArsR family transcriptional regulator, arsenate/arsenite/antimonite-responsive transcriptional repressor
VSKSLELLPVADPAACCPPLAQEPLTAEQAQQVAPLLKALADPVRLRLMSLVASHPGGEACVCDLNGAFDLSQPTISHHLKVLHDSGLIDREKRGVWVYYRARTGALASLATLIGTPASTTSVRT